MLNLEDLDWERGEIRVIHGKGQKERRVPFLKEAQLPTLRYLHNRDDSYPCLWISERRRPLTYYGVYQSIHQTFKRARIEVKDAVHIFRRSFAAHAVRQGMPRQYTQAIAGWSTTQMLDRYTAAMAEEEGAIEAFRNFKPFGAEDWGPIGYDCYMIFYAHGDHLRLIMRAVIYGLLWVGFLFIAQSCGGTATPAPTATVPGEYRRSLPVPREPTLPPPYPQLFLGSQPLPLPQHPSQGRHPP